VGGGVGGHGGWSKGNPGEIEGKTRRPGPRRDATQSAPCYDLGRKRAGDKEGKGTEERPKGPPLKNRRV